MNPFDHECPPEFRDGEVLPEAVVKRWLKSCGAGVRIFRGARLVGPDRITLGDRTQIDEGVRIFAGEGVEIGRHVHFAFESSISGGGSCLVQDYAGIGAATRLITGTELIEGGLTNPTIPAEFRAVARGRIEIHAHALVFTGSIVLPGVVIGEGAIVSAGSIVHRSLKPWGIYAGNPLVQVGVRPRAEIDRQLG